MIGVAPGGFSGLGGIKTEMWCTLSAHSEMIPGSRVRSERYVSAVRLYVRLRRGASQGALLSEWQAPHRQVRQREIEIRFALGAQQRHVISQLLTENALLAAFGATGAIAIGRLAREALGRWSASTPDLQFTGNIQSTGRCRRPGLGCIAVLWGAPDSQASASRLQAREATKRTPRVPERSQLFFFCRHRRHSHAVALAPIGAAGCLSN